MAGRINHHIIALGAKMDMVHVPYKGAALGIERGVFTRGRAPFSYLGPLKANLFLSANADDVRGALNAGFPAAMVYTQSQVTDSHPDEVRIAFDGDAVHQA